MTEGLLCIVWFIELCLCMFKLQFLFFFLNCRFWCVCGFSIICSLCFIISKHDYRIAFSFEFYRSLFFFSFVPWWNLTNFCFSFFLRFSSPEMQCRYSHSETMCSTITLQLSMHDAITEQQWKLRQEFFSYCLHSKYYLWWFLWFFTSLSSEWTGLTEWEWTTTLIIIAWTHSHATRNMFILKF